MPSPSLLLPWLPAFPAAGALAVSLMPADRESWIARTANAAAALLACAVLLTLGAWWHSGRVAVDAAWMTLYSHGDTTIALRAYLDHVSAVFLLVGCWLTLLITLYSRLYLHRETGYRRYFVTILLFLSGYVMTVSSGNLETLFIGWELLGLSSFLLIAFYRDRYLPVKHAVKVFSVYRIGDVGLLLTLWLSHHLWHANVSFSQLLGTNGATLPVAHGTTLMIAVLLAVAAAAKSAQFPFSSWLPRAMEGPTPSSAIFYGSLAVHLGLFLLLRTEAYWGGHEAVRWCIGGIGLVTALVGSGIARAQASVKSQIAYASLAQIGVMFLEVAAGLPELALVHFAGNAFLRTYQLLVSPSVAAYLVREQFFVAPPPRSRVANWMPEWLVASVYLLSLKEWNLDALLYRTLWNPLKWLGTRLDVTSERRRPVAVLAALLAVAAAFGGGALPPQFREAASLACALVAVVLALTAFTKRRRPMLAWLLLAANHVGLVLAVNLVSPLSVAELGLYLGAVLSASSVGWWCLQTLERATGTLTLDRFHGHAEQHPRLALAFLLACLAVSAFPITPAFVGEDLLLAHVQPSQVALAAAIATSVVLDALAAIRLYARLFLGPAVRARRVSYRAA